MTLGPVFWARLARLVIELALLAVAHARRQGGLPYASGVAAEAALQETRRVLDDVQAARAAVDRTLRDDPERLRDDDGFRRD